MTEIVKAYTLVDGKIVGFRSTDNPQDHEVVLDDEDALVVAFYAPPVEPIAEAVNPIAPVVNQEQPAVNEKQGKGLLSWLTGK
ncbi:MAG: hypothetical protein V4536_08770 [Pseudomonadota bacterium]